MERYSNLTLCKGDPIAKVRMDLHEFNVRMDFFKNVRITFLLCISLPMYLSTSAFPMWLHLLFLEQKVQRNLYASPGTLQMNSHILVHWSLNFVL